MEPPAIPGWFTFGDPDGAFELVAYYFELSLGPTAAA